MSNAPHTPASDNGSEPHLDNLARLHRMSRTAGVGTTEYAAVNVPAVMTAVLGAASFLALVTPVFLVIAVAGVIVGVIAIRQVLASNGTQTGLTIAILGLLACAGFSAAAGYQVYGQRQQVKADEVALKNLIHDFGQLAADAKYDQAYALLDPRFQDRVTPDRFKTFFEGQLEPTFGQMTGIESNGIFRIDQTEEDGMRYARGLAEVGFAKKDASRSLNPQIDYRYSSGQWRIFAINEFFPPATQDAGPPELGPMGPQLPQ